jgi:uncharacterized protein (DUF362 family)/NAD-dependent dihydropyrimidine dehydrogenase PreA subunit
MHNEVKHAVAKGLALLGGIEKFITGGEKILLKVNLLIGDSPEKCVTTHPAVLKAVAEILQSSGAMVSYGDSPGFGSPQAAARKSGLTEVADPLQLNFANFTEGVEVFYDGGVQNKKFVVARGVLDADGIISLPKLKTHGLEKFTGCIKNQFGCIVGIRKGEFHVKLPDATDFAQMLVDLNNYIRPRLYIMDGIMAMEGNGPRGGDPRAMNVLLFSTDPVALDATACRMIDLNPLFVPAITCGSASGAGTYNESEIEYLGDDPKSFYQPGFKADRTPVRTFKGSLLFSSLNKSLIPKPVIVEDNCTKCGTCIANCPVESKAINWYREDKSMPPVYDYDKCIRCYCCQELCPEHAIILKLPVLRRIVNALS